jgi:hypothetical protein
VHTALKTVVELSLATTTGKNLRLDNELFMACVAMK